MLRTVASESSRARAIARRSPFTSVTWALLIATFVPVPIAIPTLAPSARRRSASAATAAGSPPASRSKCGIAEGDHAILHATTHSHAGGRLEVFRLGEYHAATSCGLNDRVGERMFTPLLLAHTQIMRVLTDLI